MVCARPVFLALKPMQTTVGQLLINDALPEDLRDYNRVLDKKGLKGLLRDVMKQYPDQYKDIVHRLNIIGSDAAMSVGSSFSVSDLKSSRVKKRVVSEINNKLRAIEADPTVSDDQRNNKIVELLLSRLDEVRDKTYAEGLDEGNNFSRMVLSGARGNPANLSSLRGADLLVLDHKDRPIPVPILNNYSEGLSPAEYFASAYGTRKGIVTTKMATAQAGFLNKQLANASGGLVVTDEDPLPDTGLPVDTDDEDNEGAVLARDYGDYKAGTVLSPSILRSLRKNRKEILVHSPISAGGSGVPQLAAGYRERGGFSPVGDNVGIASAQAIGEPMSQGMLCLVIGTMVRMADGSVKQIETIESGDVVLGANAEGETFPSKVVQTYSNGRKPCIVTSFYRLRNNTPIHLASTADHKLLVTGGSDRERIVPVSCEWRNAALADGGIAQKSSMYLLGDWDTYDIEVDNEDHLFVLENGLIVSNSSKHGAGVVGASHESIGGFQAINQLVQVPKSFVRAATLASKDGRVELVEDAPQGGKYVLVGGERHYVHPDIKVDVKVGDTVEAGDALSEGIPNPAEIVKYKHIGEGRRYLANRLRKTLLEQGISINRRNLEVVSRGLINHVKVVEPDGLDGSLPDDIVSYDKLAQTYKPRFGSMLLSPLRAKNKYLEKPTLHYSIGTRVTPSVADTMRRHGVSQVTAHDDPPPFEPHMVRAMESTLHDKDFMRRLQGFYIGKGFLDAVHRGGESQVHGQNWGHSLATAKDFGKNLETSGVY